MIAMLVLGCVASDVDTDAEMVEAVGPSWAYEQPVVLDLGEVLRLEWATSVCVDGVCVADEALVWWAAEPTTATIEPDGLVWSEIERCDANGRPEGDGTATLLVVAALYGAEDSVVASAAPARVPWECR